MERKIKAFLLIIMTVTTTAFAGENGAVMASLEKDRSSLKRKTVSAPLHTETYEYYEICGSCERDLLDQMTRKAVMWHDGVKYDSVTSWKVKWDYDYDRSSHACSADSFRMTVNVIYRLPKWVRTGDVPQSLVDKWDAYMKHLMTHENGHGKIVLEAADELTRAVAQLSPAPTCEDLDRQVKTLCRLRLKKLDDEQKGYDESTSHGILQGALFP
jgi:predicted secreted Zn-dependent protease